MSPLRSQLVQYLELRGYTGATIRNYVQARPELVEGHVLSLSKQCQAVLRVAGLLATENTFGQGARVADLPQPLSDHLRSNRPKLRLNAAH